MENIWYTGNEKIGNSWVCRGHRKPRVYPLLTSFLHRNEKAPCEGQSPFPSSKEGNLTSFLHRNEKAPCEGQSPFSSSKEGMVMWRSCHRISLQALWQGAKASCSSCNTSCALTYWDTCQKLAAWQGKLEVQWLHVLYSVEHRKKKESKGLTIRKIIRLVSISLHVWVCL